MNELDLGPIRERIEKATPGEWLPLKPIQAVATRPMREDDDDDDETIESIGLMVGPKEAVCMVLAEDPLRNEPDTDKMWTDADLIAHAPTDLASLCTEVESLRTQLAAAQAECDRRAVAIWLAERRLGIFADDSVLAAVLGMHINEYRPWYAEIVRAAGERLNTESVHRERAKEASDEQ